MKTETVLQIVRILGQVLVEVGQIKASTQRQELRGVSVGTAIAWGDDLAAAKAELEQIVSQLEAEEAAGQPQP